jgi:acyl-CoA synthetase (AMP-forming)/AMP-acid ligase II
LLAPLSAGGSVVCTPGFNALKFMGLLESEAPTWYSAVPTMHQAILERAQRQPDTARKAGLRFIRSSSASLPPPVFAALAETFGCPVIEAYGMTEATHQMTSNPLPAGRQKAGSVGLPAGPDVRIADPAGRFITYGHEGEIVIRGPSVTQGYVANPKANGEAFFDGGDGNGRWFRTGDLGVFDAEGYLTISGRIKEMINRGGEKIAPREVDDVLMDHPAVAQAVTFSMPHAKLGEEVAAAVVLKEGVDASEEAIKAHAATRLAAFKVPRKIVILAEIPKGATGKLQRIGLAQKLGLG